MALSGGRVAAGGAGGGGAGAAVAADDAAAPAGRFVLPAIVRALAWLLNSRLFGPILRDWHEHRAVRRPVKLVAVAVLIAVIAGSFVRDLPAAVRVAIVLVCAVGLMVLWRLPSRPPEGAQ